MASLDTQGVDAVHGSNLTRHASDQVGLPVTASFDQILDLFIEQKATQEKTQPPPGYRQQIMDIYNGNDANAQQEMRDQMYDLVQKEAKLQRRSTPTTQSPAIQSPSTVGLPPTATFDQIVDLYIEQKAQQEGQAPPDIPGSPGHIAV